jgi:hypothetical protein
MSELEFSLVNSSIQDKIHLEHEAAKLFMRLYEKQFGRPCGISSITCLVNPMFHVISMAADWIWKSPIYGSETQTVSRL